MIERPLPGPPSPRAAVSQHRVGLAATAAALLAVAAACGSAEMDAATGPPRDGGYVPPQPGADGGPPPDSSVIGDAPPRLFAINASPDLFEFRICFGIGGTDASLGTFSDAPPAPSDPSRPMPRTNYPGVARNGGIELPGEALAGAAVVPYLIDARYIYGRWPGHTCKDLFALGSGDFRRNRDYIALDPINGAALVKASAHVLVVTGCIPKFLDGNASKQRCGASYDGETGNVAGALIRISDGPRPAGSDMAVEFLQLSPSVPHDMAFRATFGAVDPTADAGADIVLSTGQTYLAAPPPAVIVPLPAADAGSAGFGTYVSQGVTVTANAAATDAGAGPIDAGDAGAPALRVALPLEKIQRLSSPTELPYTYFTNGNYLFALVGDATDPAKQLTLPDGGANADFDGTGLHIVAIPVTRAARDGGSQL